ncbi:MAG: inositol monophosphatase [Candidatus Krumholzibacteriota bacterium]|nr:inositol monophosphatase [Candidatus Krumholzibacteriota bacterium]
MEASLPWDEERHARLLAGLREVGDFQLAHFGGLDPERVAEKGERDLVSWVDTESEARLARLLDGLLPGAGFLGEEQGARTGAAGGPTWIVDPLDGTTNYAYRHPFFAISVALVRDRAPVLGAIHAPRLAETFHGWAGGGAWLDTPDGRREPLRVSARGEPRHALLATGFADSRSVRAEVNLRNLDRMLHATRGVRRAGAACLDLAFVAAGRLDGFWEMGLNPWDVAAGSFLVRAAGGRVTDLRGHEDALSGRQILASNGRLHDWLLAGLELDPRFDT